MPQSTPSPRRVVFQFLVPAHVEVEDGIVGRVTSGCLTPKVRAQIGVRSSQCCSTLMQAPIRSAPYTSTPAISTARNG